MATHKITFRDWFLRTWLDFKNICRYIFGIKKEGVFRLTSNYKLVFYDDFTSDYFEKWDDQDHQGLAPYHPANMNQWYDPSLISQTEEGISFGAVVKPKYFPELDTTIPNATCAIRSKESWKYGIFVFSAKMSSGTYLWPALWLSGRYNWPPEIDILEGYSDKTNDYHKNKTLKSNVHIKNEDNTGSDCAGARTHRLPNKVTEEFIEYVLWWEEKFIKIYYNGYLVRKITDPHILYGMFEDQRIIIGTGVQEGFNKDNITPVVVSKVTVYQK
jgi:beta-glucanase (GH16 family)